MHFELVSVIAFCNLVLEALRPFLKTTAIRAENILIMKQQVVFRNNFLPHIASYV